MTTRTEGQLEFSPYTLGPVRDIVGRVDRRHVTGHEAISEVRRHLADLDESRAAAHAFSLGYWGSIHEDPQVQDYVKSALTERKMWHDQQGWYFHWLADPFNWETKYRRASPVEFAVMAAVCSEIYQRGQGIFELPEVIRCPTRDGWRTLLSDMFGWMGEAVARQGESLDAATNRATAVVRPTLSCAAWLLGRPAGVSIPQTLTRAVFGLVRRDHGALEGIHPIQAQGAAMLWTAMQLWTVYYDGGSWCGWYSEAAYRLKHDLWWMSHHVQAAVTAQSAHHVSGPVTPRKSFAGDMSYPVKLIDPMRLPFCDVSFYPERGAPPSLVPVGRSGVYYQLGAYPTGPSDLCPVSVNKEAP